MQAGDRLPDLSFSLGSGETASFGDYRGKWLVLYFYPKDSTPGCTQEGIDFRDLHASFKRAGAVILGCSRDSQKSHQNFCAKHGFPFDLISDADEAVCQAFGVIKEKNMYGRKVLGIERSTFLIDPEGRLVTAWRGLKVPGHAEAVLAELKRATSAQ
jgi:thioredoxin-dependent peroxiredoxin